MIEGELIIATLNECSMSLVDIYGTGRIISAVDPVSDHETLKLVVGCPSLVGK